MSETTATHQGEKRYTERDVVLRERRAWAAGAVSYSLLSAVVALDHAARHYPLPKVTRPRVVRDVNHGDYDWKVELDMLWFRWRTASAPKWMRAGSNTENLLLVPTPERVKLWADLYARPTEEVEAERAAEKAGR